MHNLNRETKEPKNVGYFYVNIMFGKQSNENTHPLGENSPNLVTLLPSAFEACVKANKQINRKYIFLGLCTCLKLIDRAQLIAIN
jgi:hypothetical protein